MTYRRFLGFTPDRVEMYEGQEREYIDAWASLAEPLKEILEIEITGYDPDLLCHTRVSASRPYSHSFNLPTDVAQTIVRKFEIANARPTA